MIELRYDLGEKLDLSGFAKQAEHYIDCWYEIFYHIYTKDFLIEVHIRPKEFNRPHIIDFSVYKISRDNSNCVTKKDLLFPLDDSRFSNIDIIRELYSNYNDQGQIISTNVFDIVAKLCYFIRVIHKINHLKAFA